jgi:transcriptional regulator with XRE-family HTH domain
MEYRLSVRQVKAARALLGWSQGDLANASRVPKPTIKERESHGGVFGGMPHTASAVRAALEDAGVEFLYEGEAGEGVRLKKEGRPNEVTRRHRRQRVVGTLGC